MSDLESLIQTTNRLFNRLEQSISLEIDMFNNIQSIIENTEEQIDNSLQNIANIRCVYG